MLRFVFGSPLPLSIGKRVSTALLYSTTLTSNNFRLGQDLYGEPLLVLPHLEANNTTSSVKYTVGHYTKKLTQLLSVEQYEAALDVFDKSHERSIFTYFCAIRAAAALKNSAAVGEYLEELFRTSLLRKNVAENKISPYEASGALKIFTFVINYYCNTAFYKALELFETCVRYNYQPDNYLLNRILAAYLNARKLEDLIIFFEEKYKKLQTPDAQGYRFAMKACQQLQNSALLTKYAEEMKYLNIPFDEVSSQLLQNMRGSSKVDDLCNQMISLQKGQISKTEEQIYELGRDVYRAIQDATDFKVAEKLFFTLTETTQIKLKPPTVFAMAGRYAAANQFGKLLLFLQSPHAIKVLGMVSNIEILLHEILRSSKRYSEEMNRVIDYIIQYMKTQQIEFSEKIFSTLINGYFKLDAIDKMLNYYSMMKKTQFQRLNYIQKPFLHFYLMNRQYQKVIDWWNTEIFPNYLYVGEEKSNLCPQVIGIVQSALYSLQREKEAEELMKTLIYNYHFQPNEKLLNNLILSASRGTRYESMMHNYRLLKKFPQFKLHLEALKSLMMLSNTQGEYEFSEQVFEEFIRENKMNTLGEEDQKHLDVTFALYAKAVANSSKSINKVEQVIQLAEELRFSLGSFFYQWYLTLLEQNKSFDKILQIVQKRPQLRNDATIKQIVQNINKNKPQ